MKKALTLFALLLAGNLYAQEAMYIIYSPIFPSRERSIAFTYAGQKLGFHFGINGGNAKGRNDGNTLRPDDINLDDILTDEFITESYDARGVALGLTMRLSKYFTLLGGVDFIEYRAFQKWSDNDDAFVKQGEYFIKDRGLDHKKSLGYFGGIVHAGKFIGLQLAYYPATKETLVGAGVTFDLLWK